MYNSNIVLNSWESMIPLFTKLRKFASSSYSPIFLPWLSDIRWPIYSKVWSPCARRLTSFLVFLLRFRDWLVLEIGITSIFQSRHADDETQNHGLDPQGIRDCNLAMNYSEWNQTGDAHQNWNGWDVHASVKRRTTLKWKTIGIGIFYLVQCDKHTNYKQNNWWFMYTKYKEA